MSSYSEPKTDDDVVIIETGEHIKNLIMQLMICLLKNKLCEKSENAIDDLSS